MAAATKRLAPYRQVLGLIEEEFGLHLAVDHRSGLLDVVDDAVRAAGCASIDEYCRTLARPDGSALRRELVERLTVGETYFFRNPVQFDVLESAVLPALVAAALARRAEGRPRLRIWSAGCASGEEPYSVAMILLEAGVSPAGWDLEILGTDLNERWLEVARRGVYSKRSVARATSPARLARFFRAHSNEYALADEVRSLVRFQAANLVAALPPPLDKCDLVLCRNVTIYFAEAKARQALAAIIAALRSGGYLLTGHAERLPAGVGALEPVGEPGAFAYRKVARESVASGAGRRGQPRSIETPKTHSARRSPRPTRTVARRHTARASDATRPAVSLNAGDHLADATALARAGELEAAIQALRRSLFLDHTLVGARFLLAHALERAGRRDEAVGEYAAVVRALAAEDPDAPVPGADGFSAGTLRDAARRALAGGAER